MLKIKPLILLCLSVVGATSRKDDFAFIKSYDPHDFSQEEWEDYKAAFGKYYNEEEDNMRYRIAAERKAMIVDQNIKFDQKLSTFTMGFNNLTDLTVSEATSFLNGYSHSEAKPQARKAVAAKMPGYYRKLPKNVNQVSASGESINWVIENQVSPVGDQINCASDYAFAAVGALESRYAIYMNTKLTALSAQNVVDCSDVFGNYGCQNGYMGAVYEYIIVSKGLNSARAYPYTGLYNRCSFDENGALAPITGYSHVEGNQETLKATLAGGPVAAAVDASQLSFLMYSHGVYSDPDCGTKEVNHAVLIVGYGFDSETNQNYWLIKNSWGTDWGESGYMKLLRNDNNICGIFTAAIYPRFS